MTRETDTHIYFWKNKSYLTQWYKVDFYDSITGCTFNCVEQGHMLYKACLFKDYSVAKQILNAKHPSKHLELGRLVTPFDNQIWLGNRDTYLVWLHYQKYIQNSDLTGQLISTGTKTLVEASPIDMIYGVGLHEDDPLIDNPDNWKGENVLGKILMLVRSYLIQGLEPVKPNLILNKETL